MECLCEHEANYEDILRLGFDWNLKFKIVAANIGYTNYGTLPERKKIINKKDEIPIIPTSFQDVFELYSSGVAQLNFFKNSKLALLESFVAVEVLVVRITEELKISKGISKSKISKFKKEIDLAHRMEVELLMFFSFNKKEKDLLGKMVRARNIRNEIMHDNRSTSDLEIRSLLKEIKEFLFMLIRKYEKDQIKYK